MMTVLINAVRAAFGRASGKPIQEVPASIDAQPQPTPAAEPPINKFKAAIEQAGQLAKDIETGGGQRNLEETTPMTRAVDFNFLRQVEGFETKAYVPTQRGVPIEQSGVTVASGFDLGQHSAGQIRAMLPKELADKLVPYAGLKRDAALAKVRAQPLTLTKAEAEQINQIVKTKKIDEVASAFNAASKGPKFDELPKEWQTVIASVAFQYGSLQRRTPNFWRQITTGQWDAAVANLNNFGDRYSNRRKQEATLVANVRP